MPVTETTIKGVPVRNLQRITDKNYTHGYSFTFEALVDNEWWPCSMPCGDWCYVDAKGERRPPQFSVPIGWYELDDAFSKAHP